jgi:ribonuclease-3
MTEPITEGDDGLERPDPKFQQILDACQCRIKYRFRDPQWLFEALTHASRAEHRLASNERLEFLGDAILGMIVCEHLFHSLPRLMEGELTRIKSVVVSRKTCAAVSRDLGLQEFLFLGRGMQAQRSIPQSLLADVFESIVASIYLDGGWEAVTEFVGAHIIPRIAPLAAGSSDENYKSLLQQIVQRDMGQTPSYVLIEEKGPDHSKSFRVAAKVGDLQFEPAWGHNKKQAAQLAARNALEALHALS